MRSIQIPMTAAFLVALCGCATTMKVRSDYSRSAHFASLKTYAWAPGAQTGLEDPRINGAFVDPQVREDVNRELAAKGYSQVAAASADFLISYHVSLKDRFAVDNMGGGPMYDEYDVEIVGGQKYTHSVANPDRDSYLDSFEVGTLLLRVADPKTNKVIWHGAAEAMLLDNRTLDQKQQRLRQAIHLILERFPPK